MNETKHTKEKKLQIRFYEHEIQEIKRIAGEMKISPSDLGRNAVNEYLERYKNPEGYIHAVSENNQTALQFEEIEKKLNSIITHIENLASVNSQMLDIQRRFPSKIEEVEELEDKISLIEEVIKKHHKSLHYKLSKTPITLEEIINKTEIDEDVVFDILINTEKFKPIKKGWDIKNE